MLEIEIRPAEEKDYKETENIARQAFYRDDRIAEIGVGCTEPYMLHMLRKEVGIKELDFVAYVDGKAVGQIIYSHSHIRRPDGSLVDTLNFGPLSVLPEFQKMGVGSALMRYSMKRAKELGYGAILFFGHPEYYPRFGFVQASKYGIETEWQADTPAFMAIELKEGYLKDVTGIYLEAPVYDEEITKLPSLKYEKEFAGQNGEQGGR